MPARLNLTPEQFEQRVREQTRQRVKRYREKRNAAPINEGSVTTAPRNGAAQRYPPHPPASPSLSKEREKIRAALEPFVARGYAHSDRYWELASEEYPLLRLELEALKLADWLLESKNAKKLCSTRRIDNWLKTAEADRKASVAAPPRSNGIHTNGTYHPPAAFQRNPGQPDDIPLPGGVLLPISKEEFQRTLDANRGLPLEQKLARLNGRLKGAKP